MKWLIWYCERCRNAAKSEPAHYGPCQCKTPVLPIRPTTVYTPEPEDYELAGRV